MNALPAPKAPARVVQETLHIQGPPLTPVQMVLAALCVALLLWVAYRIGQVILRIVAGILFLGLVAFGIWYLFIR